MNKEMKICLMIIGAGILMGVVVFLIVQMFIPIGGSEANFSVERTYETKDDILQGFLIKDIEHCGFEGTHDLCWIYKDEELDSDFWETKLIFPERFLVIKK